MVEDLTPEHLKCSSGFCPSVHRIVIDGKRHLIVVGANAPVKAAHLGIDFGEYETPILIEEDLLSGIGCQAEVTAKGEGSAPQAAFQSGVGGEALKLAQAIHENLIAHMNTCVKREQDDSAEEFRLMAKGIRVFLQQAARSIEEAGTADERTAETAEASLTLKNFREENEKLRAALTKIAKPTVGTELMDTDEEQAEMFWQHIKSFQIIARAALTSPEATGEPHSRGTTPEAIVDGQDG
jgi:hypothetical protein